MIFQKDCPLQTLWPGPVARLYESSISSKNKFLGGNHLLIETAEQETESPQSEIGRVVRACALFLAGFLLLYLLFLALYLRFPYIRPGDNLVADMKHGLARNGNPFKTRRGESLHVMAFGYSKMMAGFNPKVFDAALSSDGLGPVESYNFGLPGDSRFVADLEAMAARGTAPDIALLMFPWPADPDPGPTFFHFIDDDQALMNDIFPFHHLPRDFFILLAEGHSLGGMRAIYERDKHLVVQVAEDRGYFFIARQSHFPHDELPAAVHPATDTPTLPSPRPVALGPIYEQLAKVLSQHHIHCLLIPSYFREGEFCPPPPVNPDTVRVLAGQPDVTVLGPDYWLYPNRFFSDPGHANRVGAELYTRDLAALVASWRKQEKDLNP